MFARAVYTLEWFFCKKTYKTVSESCLSENVHNNLVVVGRFVGVRVYAGKLKLARRNFVVLCLCRYTEFPKLSVHIRHKLSDSFRSRAVVVVGKLLTFRRFCTENCSACFFKVKALVKDFLINKEIFLLCADCRLNIGYFIKSHCMEKSDSLFVESLGCAQKRRLIVESLACKCGECRRNIQSVSDYKTRACSIPNCITAGFKCGAKTARRE